MGQKRDRLEIIHDLLRSVKERGNKIKPTPLLRHSNLSPQSFTIYLTELLEKKFIEEIEFKKAKHYACTKKGLDFMEKYNTIINIIKDFDL